jgi:DNA repair protein RadC
VKLSQLSESERPREKLLVLGPDSLSVIELLAILLRTGTKGKDVLEFSAFLLDEWGGLEGLCRAKPSELMQENGLKEAKAATLSAVLELGKRIAELKDRNMESWKAKIEAIARNTQFYDREQIFAVFLNAKEQVIGEDTISYGGQSGAYLDIPVFYRKAVRLNAYSVVLVHNHPDGSLHASREDIILTDHVKNGLGMLGIKLKGHFVSANGYLKQVP